MALFKHLNAKLKPHYTISFGVRHLSDIKKSVFVSQSKDIYANLALEDWIYKNFDFKNHHILLLWQNNPCVVIGRHQNPWLEANIPELPNIGEDGVKLARRNSGGGTVYHDNGNLNLTFFTAKENYNRKYNLSLIARSLFREYGFKVTISPREDLTVRDYKVSFISGTAAKLGRTSAYHHCTLLVNANKVDLSLALQKPEVNITTNATRSTRSNIMNLVEECPSVTVDGLIKCIGWEYLRTYPLRLIDAGMEFANKQKGFQMVNPTEQWFPGLEEIRAQYESKEWRYGKTPKFTISKTFKVPERLAYFYSSSSEITVTMLVEEGKIKNIMMSAPPDQTKLGFAGEASIVTNLIGQNFNEHVLHNLEYLLSSLDSDKDRFVTECVRQVMISA